MPVLRRPVQAAQALASIDLLSGGRLTVAVGAGFPGGSGRPLHDLSEVPWARQFARLDETVALWRQGWTSDGPSSFHGKVLRFDAIPPVTVPYQAQGGPDIWLGGASPSALGRAGRLYDGWLPYPPDPADYAAGLAQVRRAAAKAGREAAAITPALFASVLISGDAASGRAGLEQFSLANYRIPLSQLETIRPCIRGSAGARGGGAWPVRRGQRQAPRAPDRGALVAGAARAAGADRRDLPAAPARRLAMSRPRGGVTGLPRRPPARGWRAARAGRRSGR